MGIGIPWGHQTSGFLLISLSPTTRIFVCLETVDFRRGIDGLAALCRNLLGQDPLGGALFAFKNRRGTALKLLIHDGQGFWLMQKRLSQGSYRWWPKNALEAQGLTHHQLQVLLANGDPMGAKIAPAWRKIS
jgi:transposase